MPYFLNKLSTVLFFKSKVYNLFFLKKINKRILSNPESLWRGNRLNGQKIIDGFLDYQKETIFLNDNIWKKNYGSISWNKYLNSFMWISDLRALGTDKARLFTRKKILSWINDSDYTNPLLFEEDVLAKRIFFLLTNLSFFFETADQIFQKNFSENINKQCIILFNKLKKNRNLNKNIFAIKSLLLSSICFENQKNNYEFSIKLVDEAIKNSVKEGMHFMRSPSEHFFFLCSLLDIKNFINTNNKNLPLEINKTITEMSTVLKFFRIGDGQLSIFNEFDFINPYKIDNVLKKIGHKFKLPKASQCYGFHRVSKNKLTFIMDCGKPTKQKTHAGSLSFEFSHLSEKIVVNSGSPFVNNKNWNDAMRSTAAHSTLNINEINSSDIFFDRDTSSRIADVYSEQFDKNDNILINSYHTGYKDLFGIIHKRSVHIDLLNTIIRGEESFELDKKKSNHKIFHKYFLRFHIHPSIELNATKSKRKVVLKLKNNTGWEFICSESTIKIEDGIYLGDKNIIKSNQNILISGEINHEKKIKWLFRLIK